MRILLTGAAGFVGSHLSERLIELGHEVVGVDRFSDYYPRALKEQNIERLREMSGFRLVEADIAELDLAPLVDGVDAVIHQAAQAGVRASWGKSFEIYLRDNLQTTQRLLEAVKGRAVKRFVYASSSSVYGDLAAMPMREDGLPRPSSPYGVTKLAAEHLCELYRYNFGVPAVSLRYFTVYGPRQRPDMGFNKFIKAMLAKRPIAVFGDGEQTRDFTFIADAVSANVAALSGPPGVYNIGGGSRVTLNQVLTTLGDVMGESPIIERQEAQAGDVRHTWADTSAAETALGWKARTSLREGLTAQVAWQSGR